VLLEEDVAIGPSDRSAYIGRCRSSRGRYARWQMERSVPSFTLPQRRSVASFCGGILDAAIVGKLSRDVLSVVLNSALDWPAIFFAFAGCDLTQRLRDRWPRIAVLAGKRENWLGRASAGRE